MIRAEAKSKESRDRAGRFLVYYINPFNYCSLLALLLLKGQSKPCFALELIKLNQTRHNLKLLAF